jgi:hypothetical protein
MKQRIKFGLSMLVTAVMTMALILPAAQAAVVFNEQIPVSVLLFDPCTGEDIAVDTTAHVVIAGTEDGAGGQHLKLHLNLQDGSAIGLTTGDKYIPQATANAEINMPKGATEATATVNLKLISQGSAPNLDGHFNAHITVNPDGTITVAFIKGDIDCTKLM